MAEKREYSLNLSPELMGGGGGEGWRGGGLYFRTNYPLQGVHEDNKNYDFFMPVMSQNLQIKNNSQFRKYFKIWECIIKTT